MLGWCATRWPALGHWLSDSTCKATSCFGLLSCWASGAHWWEPVQDVIRRSKDWRRQCVSTGCATAAWHTATATGAGNRRERIGQQTIHHVVPRGRRALGLGHAAHVGVGAPPADWPPRPGWRLAVQRRIHSAAAVQRGALPVWRAAVEASGCGRADDLAVRRQLHLSPALRDRTQRVRRKQQPHRVAGCLVLRLDSRLGGSAAGRDVGPSISALRHKVDAVCRREGARRRAVRDAAQHALMRDLAGQPSEQRTLACALRAQHQRQAALHSTTLFTIPAQTTLSWAQRHLCLLYSRAARVCR